MPSAYAEYLAKHGGLANTGNCLGVMVADEKYICSCPSAWFFLPLGQASAEQVQDALDWMKENGRETWPSNANKGV